jgi:hypothetical protein
MTLSSGQISLIVANLMGDGGYGQVGVCVWGGGEGMILVIGIGKRAMVWLLVFSTSFCIVSAIMGLPDLLREKNLILRRATSSRWLLVILAK